MEHVNPSLNVTIDSVRITGNVRTRLSFFESELEDVLQNKGNIQSLEKELRRFTNRVKSNGSFEAMRAEVHLKGEQSGIIHSDIQIDIKESDVPQVSAGSFFQESGGSHDIGGEIKGLLRSPFGFGEKVKVMLGKTAKGSKGYLLSASVPNVSQNRGTLEICAESSRIDNSHFLGYKQNIESLSTEYRFRKGKHALVFDASLRDEVPTKQLLSTNIPLKLHSWNGGADKASLQAIEKPSLNTVASEVLASATASTKLSLKYRGTLWDSRTPSASVPASGSMLRAEVELALPLSSYSYPSNTDGGSSISIRPPSKASFLKLDVQAQTHRTFGRPLWDQPGIVFSLCGSLGSILPMPSPSSSSYPFINLSDRYHLGGPLSLRGFDLFGIGRGGLAFDDKGSGAMGTGIYRGSLGGTSKLNVLALTSVPVPLKSIAESGGRAFFFINVGGLWDRTADSLIHTQCRDAPVRRTSGGGAAAVLSALLDPLRLSIGGGFVFPVNKSARFEVTYGVPIWAQSGSARTAGDALKPFQVGFSFEVT